MADALPAVLEDGRLAADLLVQQRAGLGGGTGRPDEREPRSARHPGHGLAPAPAAAPRSSAVRLPPEHYRSKGFGTQIEPLIVKVAMMWPSAAEEKLQERSQRSRSFLFTALGAITAIMHGQRTVEMFESGVGAINLPLMAGMVGSKATRSSHPEFLRLMSKLASLVADSEIELHPAVHRPDQGRGRQALAGADLQELAASTASCVRFPLRHSKQKQCGLCPACIFRRQAAAVRRDSRSPSDAYKYDFLGPAERVNQLPEKRLGYLKAFLMQVAQLRGIEEHDRLPPAFERHVVGTGIVPKGQSQKGVIQLTRPLPGRMDGDRLGST